MLLEDFRHDLVGVNLFTLINEKGEYAHVQANYIHYSFRGFYLTMQDLEQLEFSKGQYVPDGNNSVMAASMWYLALESYLNTLLKTVCLKQGQRFEDHSNKTITDKLSTILTIFQVDPLDVKKTGVYNRLNEFMIFRNEIFHDKSLGKPLQFSKTVFSTDPANCNLVDAMQGLFRLFRRKNQ